VATICSIVGMVFGYVMTPMAVEFLAKASPEQAALGADYTQLRMLGVPAMVLTFSYKAFFDGIGKTHVHLWAALTMNVLNVIINYFLIYGYEPLGIESMGLHGAGLASALTTYIGL